jgi:outer membrane protein OmpA-like peptidoglycan-associated protein
VYDSKTKAGLPSTVELTDIANGNIVSQIQTDERGHYLITLPIGRDYAFNVNRKGYLFYSDQFLLSGNPPDSTYEKDIPLQPIEANASFVLNNIFFDNNEYALKPASRSELDKLVELLKENPGLRIEISGHTDNVGTPASNLTLSNNRALAVVNYLKEQGIAANRLQAKGYGETRPVAGNNTEAERAKNRRTEVKVLGL